MGRLTLNVLLSFAQFEREVTGERIRDKIAASKKKGMWMGGQPPLGYDVQDRKLVVNTEEAETVRHIFRRYRELKSVRLLKADLDAHGIVSKARKAADGSAYGSKPLARGALYLMLQNRIYRGETVHKDKSYPGEHDTIVEERLWNEVQAILRTNRIERADGRTDNRAEHAGRPAVRRAGRADEPQPRDQERDALSLLCIKVIDRRDRQNLNRRPTYSGRAHWRHSSRAAREIGSPTPARFIRLLGTKCRTRSGRRT